MKRHRSDQSKAAIVAALRELGVSWIDCDLLANQYKGIFDGIAVMMGEMFPVELKSEKGELSKDQERFHALWQGPHIKVLRSAEEATEWVQAHRQRW